MKMRLLPILVPLLLALGVPSAAWAQCGSDSDCKGGRICHEGQCMDPEAVPRGCANDRDCPGRDVCDSGRCIHRFGHEMGELTWTAGGLVGIDLDGYLQGADAMVFGGIGSAGVWMNNTLALALGGHVLVNSGNTGMLAMLGPTLRFHWWSETEMTIGYAWVHTQAPVGTYDSTRATPLSWHGMGLRIGTNYPLTNWLGLTVGFEYILPTTSLDGETQATSFNLGLEVRR